MPLVRRWASGAALVRAYAAGAIMAAMVGLSALARLYDRRAQLLLNHSSNLATLSDAMEAIAIYRMGVCMWAGVPELLARATWFAEQLGNKRLRNESRAVAAVVQYHTGNFAQRQAMFQEIYAAAQQGNNLHVIWGLVGQVENGLWQGVYAWQRGRKARARRAWRRSLAAAQTYQMPLEEGLVHHTRHCRAGCLVSRRIAVASARLACLCRVMSATAGLREALTHRRSRYAIIALPRHASLSLMVHQHNCGG